MAKKKKAATKGKKKSTTRKGTAAKKPTEVLLVASKVRDAIKSAGCNTGGDAIDGLNGWVYWLIQQGTARATCNGRKTVRAHDFMIM